MKNIVLALIIITVAFVSCTKEETCNYNESTVIAPASESDSINNYLTKNNITGAIKHPSGFYYKITQPGTGKSIVNLCSNVSVTYAGRFFNGTYFDPTTPGTTSSTSFPLWQVIAGWQKGLPLISSGGKLILYIPPSLGYGNKDVVNPATNLVAIPANSYLIFDVELVGVS